MIEIILIVVIVVILLLVLGISAVKIALGAIMIMEIMFLLTDFFFIVSLLFLLFSKKTTAEFKEIDSSSGYKHATYIYNDEIYNNLYPADFLSERIFYKKKNCTIFIKNIFNKNVCMDTCSLIIMSVGLPVFGALSIFLALITSMLVG